MTQTSLPFACLIELGISRIVMFTPVFASLSAAPRAAGTGNFDESVANKRGSPTLGKNVVLIELNLSANCEKE